MKKKIVVLGSTGSVGKQTLEVIDMHREQYEVVGLSAFKSIDEIQKQIQRFKPKKVAIFDESKASLLASNLGDNMKVLSGLEGLVELVTMEEADIVVTSIVGSIGLVPTLEAIKSGKTIALANKETLVIAGQLIIEEAARNDVKIIPVDSEHSAIYQCLQGEQSNNLSKIILTASGGPFREWTKEELKHAKSKEALKHPNWNMGKKISIDSATLMNKGLEAIEAKWLFNVDIENIEIVVHPQSIIHSMIELKDKSVIAQLSIPDMKIPIQYALAYPERLNSSLPSLDLKMIQNLTFFPADTERFPCLSLACEAIKIGKTMPCVLNGANEVLVEYFLDGKIGFYDIPKYIEKMMLKHDPFVYNSVEELLEVDRWVRDFLRSELK